MRRMRGALAGFVTVLVTLGSGVAQPAPAGAGWWHVPMADAVGWFQDVVWDGLRQTFDPPRAATVAEPASVEPVPGPFAESRVTYGAGVALDAPDLIRATGAELNWPAYTGTDLVEYQIHRAAGADFPLSADSFVAAVPAGTHDYADSTAREDLPDPYSMADEPVHYRVVVRTIDGRLLASLAVEALLPPPGRVRQMSEGTHGTVPMAGPGVHLIPPPPVWEEILDQGADGIYYAPRTPRLMRAGESQTAPVVLTNVSDHTWPAASTSLSYWWRLPDGTDATTFENQRFTPLPQDVAPGESVLVDAQVRAPEQLWSDGNAVEEYTLRWDVYDESEQLWKSLLHTLPQLPQQIRVDDPTSDQLGLEQFYQYAGVNTGAGTTALTNLYAGNMVWSYDAFSHPSLGVGTFVRLAYNSLDTSDSPVGFGWSLQASTVQRVGSWLQFHPPGRDWPEQVRLVDGDGTTHVFLLDTHGLDVKDCQPDTCDYTHPRGVHLYLQQTGSADPQRSWRMTRPDRTVFFFDADGYQSAAVDRNGNTMWFGYDERKSQNRPTKFLRSLTDAGGRRTLTVEYYRKGEEYTYIDDSGVKFTIDNLTDPHIIDKVRSITDVSGDPAVGGTVPERTIELVYTDKGLLAELTDGAGDQQAKVFRFNYDMQQGNKNVKLVEVDDPRGDDTRFDYYLPSEGDDPKLHWRAETTTDRLGGVTRFDYTDPDGPTGSTMLAEVTDPEGNSTNYDLDGFGRPTRVVDALGRNTHLSWDADHNVQELVAPNGAVASWTYDPKTGYPLTIRDPEAHANGTPATVLTYQTERNGFVADLATKASPEGRTWTFAYDGNGNLTSVTDPAGTATPEAGDFTTSYGYDQLGRMTSSTDANGNVTSFDSHHPSGFPQLIEDALGGVVETVYDARGNVKAVIDELDKTTTADYDLFNRPLETVRPVDQDAGEFITTPAPVYDANDNVTMATAPNGAVSSTSFDAMDRPVMIVLPQGDPDVPFRVSTITYDRAGNVLSQTEPLGNLTTPQDDFVTTYTYDAAYQLASVTDAEGNQATYAYDSVGNLLEVTDPRGNTTSHTYDLNNRRLATTDPAGESVRAEYDLDGLRIASIDQQGVRTETVHDQRGKVVEKRVPHRDGETRVTRYAYDQVGNLVRHVSPRGTATPEPDDFTQQTVYDALNRPVERLLPYDPADPDFDTPDRILFEYDPAGRMTAVSAPPSAGQSVRNRTENEFLDTGWVESTTDPWGITTRYDYNPLGQQTGRTLVSAGGSADRTMTWEYHLDGSLAARSDDGVPVGLHVVLVDNSDTQNTTTEGDWTTSPAEADGFGFDYATHAAGAGEDSFAWTLHIPADGTYEVFARWPEVAGAATDAGYTITHPGGEDTVTVDQSQHSGEWQSLGSFAFARDGDGSVTLTDDADGTVVADAVKLVRDTSGETDTEAKDITYGYDANGNLVEITDNSSGAVVDSYQVSYDQLNRVTEVRELVAGAVEHTTGFSYDPNGNLLTRDHDQQDAAFTYDNRNLLTGTTVTEPGADPKVTSYAYTARGQRATETKANGNTVEYEYLLDRGPRRQVETKPDGTLVAEHTYTYDENGNRASDLSRIMNADDPGDYLRRDSRFSYDPRDRIASVTRTDPATGEQVASESYRHDANNNVVSRTVDGQTTESVYDRNRLQTTASGGVTASYNYDPFGRLDTVTGAGQVLERYVYDGFDRIVEEHDRGVVTHKTYDPLDRTRSRVDAAGTADEQTTVFSYLGLSEQVLAEEVDGEVETTYQHSLAGQMLSQVKHEEDGTEEDSFYGYDPHGDVVDVTDEQGDTRATYGYTAYGSEDESLFTGVDAPDPEDPDQEPYNVYRFAGKRLDPASGNYDMGFRDYDPGLNRFLSRDMFNGALADMSLATDPWTMSRYSFAGGNPISLIELDGHMVTVNGGGGGGSSQSYDPPERDTGGSGDAAGLLQTVDEALKLLTSFTIDAAVALTWERAVRAYKGEVLRLVGQSADYRARATAPTNDPQRVAFSEVEMQTRHAAIDAHRRWLDASRRIGGKLPFIGLAVEGGGVAFDISQGKPADQAIVSAAGGVVASAAVVGVIATAPVSVPVLAVVGLGTAAGAGVSYLIDRHWDSITSWTGDRLNDIGGAVGAVGDAAGDVGGAIKGGVEDALNWAFG